MGSFEENKAYAAQEDDVFVSYHHQNAYEVHDLNYNSLTMAGKKRWLTTS